MSAFIFDVDGTLADTEDLHREAFNEAFAAAGLDWVWDRPLYKRLLSVSGGKERLSRFLDIEGIDRPDAAARIAALHARKTEIYAGAVAAGRLALRPGVAALIAEAKGRGIRLAIATTTTRANVDALLIAAGLESTGFETMVCGDDVPFKKPSPDVYLAVLEALDLPAGACLAFEDSWNGLTSAKAAGLRCVVTPAFYTEDEDFSAADLVVSDLRDADRFVRMVAAI